MWTKSLSRTDVFVIFLIILGVGFVFIEFRVVNTYTCPFGYHPCLKKSDECKFSGCTECISEETQKCSPAKKESEIRNNSRGFADGLILVAIGVIIFFVNRIYIHCKRATQQIEGQV